MELNIPKRHLWAAAVIAIVSFMSWQFGFTKGRAKAESHYELFKQMTIESVLEGF